MLSRLFGTAFNRSDSRTRPRLPSLPSELIDHILEYLEADFLSRDPTPKSRATALSYCRVSKQFLPFGRRMLYGKLLITYGKAARLGKYDTVQKLAELKKVQGPSLLDNTSAVHVRESLAEVLDVQRIIHTCTIAELSLPWTSDSVVHLAQFVNFGAHLQTLHIEAPYNGTRFKQHRAILSGFRIGNIIGLDKLRRLSLTNMSEVHTWSIPPFPVMTELCLTQCQPPAIQHMLDRFGDQLTHLELAATTIQDAFVLLIHNSPMNRIKTLVISFLRTPSDINRGVQSWRSSIVSFLIWTPKLEKLELRFTKKTADVVFRNKRPELCLGLPDGVQRVVVRVIAEGGGDGDGTVECRRTESRCEQHGKDYVCYGQEVF